jgi:hypothetical protein
MTYGLTTTGLNNSLPISSYSSSLVFRGKAYRVTGTGLSYYPAEQPGTDVYFTTYIGGGNSGSYTVDYATGLTGQVRGIQRTISTFGGGTQTVLLFTSTAVKDIGVFTYRIICYSKPTVFSSSTSPTTKAGVLSIVQNGTSSGVPIWDIKINVAFTLGTAENVFLSYIELYCFSETHLTDSIGGYGLQSFKQDGSIAYTSTSKILRISDSVTLTAASNPPNIADMIYTRTYNPNPETSMFSLAKPGFLNVDFSRYNYRQFAYNHQQISGGSTRVYYKMWWWLDTKIINTGVAIKNGELDFSLSVIDATSVVQVYSTSSSSSPLVAPPYTQQIIDRQEIFPITIPVIDCTLYD